MVFDDACRTGQPAASLCLFADVQRDKSQPKGATGGLAWLALFLERLMSPRENFKTFPVATAEMRCRRKRRQILARKRGGAIRCGKLRERRVPRRFAQRFTATLQGLCAILARFTGELSADIFRQTDRLPNERLELLMGRFWYSEVERNLVGNSDAITFQGYDLFGVIGDNANIFEAQID